MTGRRGEIRGESNEGHIFSPDERDLKIRKQVTCCWETVRGKVGRAKRYPESIKFHPCNAHCLSISSEFALLLTEALCMKKRTKY